jgi:gluconate kinase
MTYYSRARIELHDLEPRGQQGEVIDSICDEFIKHKRGVYFIHGVSGAGKSTIGMLIASRLKGTFCHTFNPTDPGDTLHHLLRDSEPTDEQPTVILLEEVNTMIRAVHENAIQKHKNVCTCIHNKSTYNTFMDDLILYRNLMIIMTSNEAKDAIDALDPCYLRKGRVHGYYSMMEPLAGEPTVLEN